MATASRARDLRKFWTLGELLEKNRLPKTAGSAQLKFDVSGVILSVVRNGDLIAISAPSEAVFVPLVGGRQFVCWYEDNEDHVVFSRFTGFFAGTDESPFVVELADWFVGEISSYPRRDFGPRFYQALVPERIADYRKKWPDSPQPKRQGEVWVLPLPFS